MKSYTICVCPDCGALASNWLVTHTADCPNESELQKVEVVPRSLADELAEALQDVNSAGRGIEDQRQRVLRRYQAAVSG